ncbi:MAG: hypothetical protein AAGA23_12895 [Pseudomonadota bacterium]
MNISLDRIILTMALVASPVAAVGIDIDPVVLRTLIENDEGKAVVSQMESLLAAHPATADAHYWLAEGHLAQIEAATTFRKLSLARASKNNLLAALELDPGHVAARSSLGQFYLQAPAIAGGSRKEARAQADALMALDEAAGLRLKADIARDEDEPELAVAYQRRALAAGSWDWDSQYALVIQAVHLQVQDAKSVLDEAERNLRQYAAEDVRAQRLIDYQRGKYAAVSGEALAAGQGGLTRYLTFEPQTGDPGLDWAEFRLAQVERQLGEASAANARLARLEAGDVPEDLGFALHDERRWHYHD